jgi:hypothetical protein
MTSCRVLLMIAGLLLVMLMVVLPTADLCAFGIHDHVATSAADAAEIHAGHAHTSPQNAHHCDLWTNPAETADACVLVSPVLSSTRLSPPLIAHLAPRPFQPFAPPRA